MKLLKFSVLVFILIAIFFTPVLSHPGRTDSRGGHRDRKNASGLGSYHYHCGGHPPHMHTDGICPYDYVTPNNNSNVFILFIIGGGISLLIIYNVIFSPDKNRERANKRMQKKCAETSPIQNEFVEIKKTDIVPIHCSKCSSKMVIRRIKNQSYYVCTFCHKTKRIKI